MGANRHPQHDLVLDNQHHWWCSPGRSPWDRLTLPAHLSPRKLTT
jgi:hypothetical protein